MTLFPPYTDAGQIEVGAEKAKLRLAQACEVRDSLPPDTDNALRVDAMLEVLDAMAVAEEFYLHGGRIA